jgi:hypothetical protein
MSHKNTALPEKVSSCGIMLKFEEDDKLVVVAK